MWVVMDRLWRARARATHLALGVLLITGFSRAQSSAADKAAAESLFQRGLELMEAGKIGEGCDKLEQSQNIERGIGTSLYLAECYEKAGRTASAWGLFREASSEAQARGETERALAGKRRADNLEPLLSRLTLHVAPEGMVPGLEVLRDGKLVQEGLWNVSVPVDPGEHRVQARAPGYAEWAAVVKVEGNSATATASVPALTPLGAPSVPAGTAAPLPSPVTTSPSPALASHDHEPRHAGATQRTMGLLIGGVGVVALGVGGFFGLRAISKNDDAKKHCPRGGGTICDDPAGESLAGEAQDAARLANVFVIGGAIAAAGGAVLFFAAPSDTSKRVGLSADGHGAQVTMRGAF